MLQKEMNYSASDQDHIIHIRKKVQSDVKTVRFKKRCDAFNIRRKAFEDITTELNLPSILEMTEMTKKLIKHKDVHILRKLRLGLNGGEDYTKAVLDVESSLYVIIGCFTGKNKDLQIEAGCTIINLGLGNKSQCYEVAVKVGTYLITNMSSGNHFLEDISVWSYGNLCCDNPKVCSLAQCQGLEPILVKLLDSNFPEVLQSTFYTIFQYFTVVPDRIVHVMQIDTTKKILQHLVKSACAFEISWCLFLLSTEKTICQQLVDQKIIDIALCKLRQIDLKNQVDELGTVTALIRCLSNCVAIVPEATFEMCQRTEELLSTLSPLLQSRYRHLEIDILQFIANIYNVLSSSEPGCVSMRENDFKLKLLPLIQMSIPFNA